MKSINKKTKLSYPTNKETPKVPQHLPEESGMSPHEEVPNEWSAEEIPIRYRDRILSSVPKDVRQRVRATHTGLGHPSRPTMVKMMRLAGANKEALDYAKTWECPFCKAAAAPSKPLNASTRLRPFRFNHTVACDLKYLKDSRKKTHVALHIVCCGTGFQAASFLKNRTSRNVAHKLIELWVAHYGVP